MSDPSQLAVLIPGLAFWIGLIVHAWRAERPMRSRRASHDSAGIDIGDLGG